MFGPEPKPQPAPVSEPDDKLIDDNEFGEPNDDNDADETITD